MIFSRIITIEQFGRLDICLRSPFSLKMTVTTDVYKRQLLDHFRYVPPRLLDYWTTLVSLLTLARRLVGPVGPARLLGLIAAELGLLGLLTLGY